MSLCKYRDKLGIPRQGFHKNRIPGIDIALNDTLVTIGVGLFISILISIIFKKNFIIIFIINFLILFIIGIGVHRLFCVNTTINKAIFGEL